MFVRILLPTLVIALLVVGAFVWYRRKIADMSPGDAPTTSGVRLTSERLRGLASPPWRVVFEIAPDRLDGVDHVVTGPAGVFALRTMLSDRPATSNASPHAVAEAAVARGGVDELVTAVGGRCLMTVDVHWGAPRPDESPVTELAAGSIAVEGQRLVDWFVGLPPAAATPAQVDQWWQAITTGIGRPDPLA